MWKPSKQIKSLKQNFASYDMGHMKLTTSKKLSKRWFFEDKKTLRATLNTRVSFYEVSLFERGYFVRLLILWHLIALARWVKIRR